MKKYAFYLSLFALSWSGTLCAQSLSPTVQASAGQRLRAGNAQLEFTVGEVAVQNHRGNTQLTEGFHQPQLIINALTKRADFSVELFPNPTADEVHIQQAKPKALQVHLYDLQGRLLRTEQMLSTTHTLEVQHLPAATYLVQLVDTTGAQVEYRLIVRR